MRDTALAVILSAATFTSMGVMAQYENNPPQQELWKVFQAAAPYYVALKDCEREYTAQLVWDEMDRAASLIVANEADAKIAYNMWEAARQNTRNEHQRELAYARENPESSFCDKMEDAAIDALGVETY